MKKILTQNDKYYLQDNSESQEGLTLKELIQKINSNPNFFEEYEVSDELLSLIIEEETFANKGYLVPIFTFSQEMVQKLLDKEYLKVSDLQYLTLNTYINFNKDFINEFQEHLNWNKVILRKANVTGLVSFNVLEKNKINELNLWDLASSFQLEKKFIKKNREKLNWDIISITNDFTYDELSDYPELVNYKADGIEEKIKPIEETTLNEDGFLAFDNVKPMDNDATEELHKLRRELLQKQKQQDADTKEIIDKMAAIRKEVYKDFKPHVVGKTPKPIVNIDVITNKKEFININGITYSTTEDLRNVKSSNDFTYNEYFKKSEEVPETPNVVKFEDDFFEITKPETKIIEELVEDAKVLNHNILSHTFSQTFTIPLGNTDHEIAKKALAELISNYQKDINVDVTTGELILDGKTQIPYEKEIWFPSPNSENIELSGASLITDTPTTNLTDIFIPVKEEKISKISKLFNKIKSIFNGK